MSRYFDNDNTLKDEKQIIEIRLNDKKYSFYTNNGVFSKTKLDYGTRLLLENIKNIKGHILDLGCGYGVIGITIANNNDVNVDMVDINDKALELTKENAKLNHVTNVNVFNSFAYDNIKSKYNYIITNPPIRAGKEILRTFLIDAKDYLKENGELWFVMRKDHGVKTMIKELEQFYKITIITKDKGFYIVKCNIN